MEASANTQAMPRRRAGRRMLLAVVAALLVSLIVLLAAGTPSQAIVGGSKVKVGAYRFMAYLTVTGPNGKSFTCGGTLIDRDSVLTAAHCLQGFASVDVIVGATKVGVGQGVVRDGVKAAIPGEQWYPGPYIDAKRYDVGVLTLNQPVTGIKPIRLATVKQDGLEKRGNKATVAGWGRTARGSGPGVEWLRKTRINIKGDKYGKEAYNVFRPRYAPPIMIAAGSFKKGATKGDSGGPLFVKKRGLPPTQIGIVSWGDEAIGCHLEPRYKCPGVFTEVNNRSIRQFITYTMKQ